MLLECFVLGDAMNAFRHPWVEYLLTATLRAGVYNKTTITIIKEQF